MCSTVRSISLVLLVCICTLTSAACIPARMPTDGNDPDQYDETSKSKASGSPTACVPLGQDDTNVLRLSASTALTYVDGNMTTAFNTLNVSESTLDTFTGFYPGSTTESDQEILARGIPFLCCAVPYILDVMKQEAVGPVLGVSASFHNVYDILDPADTTNLASTLQRLVLGNDLNNCIIPTSAVCQNMTMDSIDERQFAALVATNLSNLAQDLSESLNGALS